MTPRGAFLLLLSTVPVVLSAAQPALLIPGMLCVAFATALVILDSRLAPGRPKISVVRRHDEIFSVGRANQVDVEVSVRGKSKLRARIHDEYPSRLVARDAEQTLEIPGVMRYTIKPGVRGEEKFGDVVMRARGPAGLGYRQTRFPLAETVTVEADLAAIREYQALARRGQLAELGVRVQRRPGEGTEFERIREAVPDDSLRFINWKATARTGRLMATELIPERAQPIVVCIDHGRLMGVGAGEMTKFDHAINAALLLAHVSLSSGDRAGLLTFSDHVTKTLKPQSGRAQLRRILDAVRPLRADEFESDFNEALEFLSRWQTRRALVCIFTDVIDPEQSEALISQCTRLRRQHLPLVITVRDPALIDAARRTPRSAEDAYGRAVAAGVAGDREHTLALLRRNKIETLDSDVRTLSPRLVNRYLELKRRARI